MKQKREWNIATGLWSSVMLHLIYNNILMKFEETEDYFTLNVSSQYFTARPLNYKSCHVE